MVDERLLQRVQFFARGQALDRRDVVAVLHDGEREAGVDAAAVQQHRARAALAVVAALLGAGEAGAFAQQVEQGDPRFDVEGAVLAVDAQPDGVLLTGVHDHPRFERRLYLKDLTPAVRFDDTHKPSVTFAQQNSCFSHK